MMEFTSCQKNAMANLIKWWESATKQYFVLAGYAGCVDPSTVIMTEFGDMTLDEIFDYGGMPKDVLEFSTWLGKPLKVYTHKHRWREIQRTYVTDIKDGFHIILECGREIKCSIDHPLMVSVEPTLSGKLIEDLMRTFDWVRASNIRIGHHIQTFDLPISSGKVVSITPIRQRFFDIEVEEDSSFIGNGIVNHNTGKSTIIESLVNELRSRVKGGAKKNTFSQASMEMYRDFVDDSMFIVRYCTFTGKAAQVLRSKGLPAVTIHSLIYSPQVNPQTDEVTFNLKNRTELGDVDLIVVDEASMVNETMREELLSFGIPIIFVGDPGQLGPIATEGSTSNIMDQADVFMTTITRQAEDSPIITLATLARTGKHIPLKIFSSEVAVFPSSKMSPAGLLKADQILCGRNETRKLINERCRESLGFTSRFPQPGDKLICTKNNFDIGHINGLIGVCNEITVPDDFLFSGEMKLSFSAPDDNIHTNTTAFAGNFYEAAGEERFKFSKKGLRDMEFFEFGYAITVHKSQGSSYTYPVVIEEPLGTFDDRKRWMYTAITRASQKLIILRGNPGDIWKNK